MKPPNKPGLIFLLYICLFASSGSAFASDPPIKTYLLNEPVFNGQTFIVEAGKSMPGRSSLPFSVSRINSKCLQKYLHGPVVLNPDEGM